MIIEMSEGNIDDAALIGTLKPEPGDVFVLQMKRSYGDGPMVDKLGKALREAAGGEIKLIVIGSHVDLYKLTDEMLERIGLCRKQDS